MIKTAFPLRVCLCLLLLSACAPRPAPAVVQTPTLPALTPTTAPKPAPTFEPPPKVELDESFYSNPQRLGDATRAYELLQPPEASLISLNLFKGEYLVEVIAEPGAVPPNSRVVIANMETMAFKLFKADDQGGFRAEIEGYPGAYLTIKQDSTGRILAFDSVDNMSAFGYILAPGVILQVPFESRDDGRIPVATGWCCDHFLAPWIFEGSISADHVQAGGSFAWEGKIRMFSDGPEPPDPASFAVHAVYLSDAQGRQVGNAADAFLSAFLTPTGLGIERSLGPHQIELLVKDDFSWQQAGQTWTASVSGEAQLPENIRYGRYALFAGLYNMRQIPERSDEPVIGMLRPRCCNGTWLTVLEVGEPAPTRLTSTLLADTLSEGSRGGVIAREDRGLFEFSARAVTHHNPVIPRLDAFDVPWSYQLGPFLPMIGGGDRVPPPKPAIDFEFTTAELSI